MMRYVLFCDGEELTSELSDRLKLPDDVPRIIPPLSSPETVRGVFMGLAACLRGHRIELRDGDGRVLDQMTFQPFMADVATRQLTNAESAAGRKAGTLESQKMYTWRVTERQHEVVARRALESGRSINAYMSYVMGFESEPPVGRPRGRAVKLNKEAKVLDARSIGANGTDGATPPVPGVPGGEDHAYTAQPDGKCS